MPRGSRCANARTSGTTRPTTDGGAGEVASDERHTNPATLRARESSLHDEEETMIDKLAKELGMGADALLSLIHRVAEHDLYRAGVNREIFEYEDWSRLMRKHSPSGWSAAIICGPDGIVYSRAMGPFA